MAQTNEPSRRAQKIARRARKQQCSFGVEAKVPPNLVAVRVELKASLEHCEGQQQGTYLVLEIVLRSQPRGGRAKPRI